MSYYLLNDNTIGVVNESLDNDDKEGAVISSFGIEECGRFSDLGEADEFETEMRENGLNVARFDGYHETFIVAGNNDEATLQEALENLQDRYSMTSYDVYTYDEYGEPLDGQGDYLADYEEDAFGPAGGSVVCELPVEDLDQAVALVSKCKEITDFLYDHDMLIKPVLQELCDGSPWIKREINETMKEIEKDDHEKELGDVMNDCQERADGQETQNPSEPSKNNDEPEL